MDKKRGYLLIESILHIAILSIIISILYSLLFFNLNSFTIVSDKIELEQQSYSISNYIESKIKLATNIEKVTLKNNSIIEDEDFENKDIISIKYNVNNRIDEFYYNRITKKLFYRKDCIKPGYEIGDYIENINISRKQNGNLLIVKIDLSKNNEFIESEFVLKLRNYGG